MMSEDTRSLVIITRQIGIGFEPNLKRLIIFILIPRFVSFILSSSSDTFVGMPFSTTLKL